MMTTILLFFIATYTTITLIPKIQRFLDMKVELELSTKDKRKRLQEKKNSGVETSDSFSAKKYINIPQSTEYKNTSLYTFQSGFMKMVESTIKSLMKTEEEKKLEKHGFTSSKNYTYTLEDGDVKIYELINYYKKKYPENLFIADRFIQDEIEFTMGELEIKKTIHFRIIDPKDYKKVVPRKALEDLDIFKFDKEDMPILVRDSFDKKDEGKIIVNSYKEVYKSLGLSGSGGFMDETADRRMNSIVNENGFIITARSGQFEIFRDNDLDYQKTYKLKSIKDRKLIILDKNRNQNKNLSFNEYVEHEKNPNKDIDVLVLQPVRGGYLVITGW